MTLRHGRPVNNSIVRHQPRGTHAGMGQDTSSSGEYAVAAGPPAVSTSDLQTQINALQGQVSATGDVVSSILASSPAVQTTPGIATGTIAGSSSTSTATLILLAGGLLILMTAMRD